MSNNDWDYFSKDPHYSDVLRQRLANGVEMDSAKAMAGYLDRYCRGDLRIVDFGGGPGHYYPVLARGYTQGNLSYHSVDIDVANIDYGTQHFRDAENVTFAVGSVLEPAASVGPEINCIVSANTLPHVPSIEPLLQLLADRAALKYFVFRMLVGNECVQIKKHLLENEFEHMFERDFQFNNIYSVKYLASKLGTGWELVVEDDVFDLARLEQHRLPAQDSDAFYGNRVSRAMGSMVFKGDIYMPWKFLIGRRAAGS